MTWPPEYEQVAQWLRAINDDPKLLQELASEYHGIKYAVEDGLTLDRYIGEQRHLLAERGRRALGGIDLDGKSTDQIAEEYHAGQIAECAHRIRDLEERIHALETGNFPVPAWCAQDAVRDGISLAEAIERYRQDEIDAAAQALDHLGEYAVGTYEIQAYWAGRDSRAGDDNPGDNRKAAAGRVGQDTPAPGPSRGHASGPGAAGPGLMPGRAASSAVRPARAASSSPGPGAGLTGMPPGVRLDFPNTVTQGIPARPAAPTASQPARPIRSPENAVTRRPAARRRPAK